VCGRGTLVPGRLAVLGATTKGQDMKRIVRFVRDESGAATAEYAIATMAAVGFAGLLVVIMRSDEVRGILTDLVRRALTFGG
jgi:Flp pilus assembly pilin Flp